MSFVVVVHHKISGKLSRIVVTFLSRPLPAVPFWISPKPAITELGPQGEPEGQHHETVPNLPCLAQEDLDQPYWKVLAISCDPCKTQNPICTQAPRFKAESRRILKKCETVKSKIGHSCIHFRIFPAAVVATSRCILGLRRICILHSWRSQVRRLSVAFVTVCVSHKTQNSLWLKSRFRGNSRNRAKGRSRSRFYCRGRTF